MVGWKCARAGTLAKASLGLEVVMPPGLRHLPRRLALVVLLGLAAGAVQHFPVAWTLRLTGRFGLLSPTALTLWPIAMARHRLRSRPSPPHAGTRTRCAP